MSKKKKKSYPKTKVKKSNADLLSFAIMNIVMYMEIAKDARIVLVRNKKLTPFIDMKIKLEVNFCENVLRNLFRVSGAEVLRITDKLKVDEEWEGEVNAFVDTVSPGSTKKVRLFNEQDFRGELANQERTKKADRTVRDGKLII